MGFDVVTYAILKNYIDCLGGSGGTTNYNNLIYKPKINSIELKGNMSATELGFPEVAVSGLYEDLLGTPIVPTKLSELQNDTNFITNTVSNLVNYYSKSETYSKQETYTKDETNQLINNISTLNVMIVDTLPTTNIGTNVIYLIKVNDTNVYEQWMYINGVWSNIGSTEIDLNNYYTKTQVNNLLNSKVDKIPGYGLSQVDFTPDDKAKLDSTTEYVLPRANVGQLGGIKTDGKTSSTKSDGTLMIMFPDGTDLINDTTAATNRTWSSVKIKDEINAASGGSLISDGTVSSTKTWSSQKLNTELGKTAKIDDTTKNTTSTWSSEKISGEVGKVGDIVNDINIAQRTVNNNIDYCFASMSKLSPPGQDNLSANTTQGATLEFYPYFSKGVGFNEENHTFKLKGGKTYALEALARISAPVNQYFYISIWDNTNSKLLGTDGLSAMVTSLSQSVFPAKSILKPETDIEVSIRIRYTTTNSSTINVSYFIIQEIGKEIVVDPVNYINTTQGIEDTPVGNLITVAGGITPKHYIPHNGAILNIDDYPYLAQFIKDSFGSFNYFGGDGVTTFSPGGKPLSPNMVDVTPTMASNTTPVPYVASSSSQYDATTSPYLAFNGSNSTPQSFFLTANGQPTGWLKLDFGKKQRVSSFTLHAHTASLSTVLTHLPKDFDIYGSNDNVIYEKIFGVTNQTGWTNNEKRTYNFNATVNYRYYRFDILANNGNNYTIVPELRYLADLRESTEYIKYEPTYFMEVEGLIETTTLWEGETVWGGKNTTYKSHLALSDSAGNYDKIGVYSTARYTGGEGKRLLYNEAPRENIIKVLQDKVPLTSVNFAWGYNDSSHIDYVDISGLDGGSLSNFTVTTYNQTVQKIVGIKYKTFQKGV